MDTPTADTPTADTPKLQYIASPGVAIIEEIQEENSGLRLSNEIKGRVRQGKILSMGGPTTGSAGEPVTPEQFGKEGDIVLFMSYYEEGGSDYGIVSGKKLFFVKWGDLRGKKI